MITNVAICTGLAISIIFFVIFSYQYRKKQIATSTFIECILAGFATSIFGGICAGIMVFILYIV